ncbi:MAG TPA: hypothetical protein VGY57_00345 [Vicinamibacterales bacterium]|nr:hypothetical protein [Vicinamibacterales bacterium]
MRDDRRKQRERRKVVRALVGVLVTALGGVAASAGCVAVNAISPERAAAERAAIHQDLRRDSETLFKIASDRARLQHPELLGRRVVCAIADIQTTFKSETHAFYTASYVCGVGSWHPNQGAPVATPTIALDLLKEGRGTWMINAFL